MMGRRIGALVAAGVTGMAAATTVAGQAIAAPRKDSGPRPVSQLMQPVDPHRSQLVSVRWTTDRRVCDVKVTVWGNQNVRVSYPGRRDHASLSRGDRLRAGRTDVTEFRVTADFDRPVWAILAARVTYDHCGRDARTITKNTGLLLPVRGT